MLISNFALRQAQGPLNLSLVIGLPGSVTSGWLINDNDSCDLHFKLNLFKT